MFNIISVHKLNHGQFTLYHITVLIIIVLIGENIIIRISVIVLINFQIVCFHLLYFVLI